MKYTTEKIEIPVSKNKLMLMLISSIIFVAGGVRFVTNPESVSNSSAANPTFIFVLGIVTILFFGFCAIYMFRKLFDNKPGFIIDSLGLTDNSSGVSVGQIPWSEIENILVVKIKKTKLIMLEIKNQKEFIDNQKSGFKRKMMQMNINLYGVPVSITSNSLKIKFDDLFNIINEYWNANRKSE